MIFCYVCFFVVVFYRCKTVWTSLQSTYKHWVRISMSFELDLKFSSFTESIGQCFVTHKVDSTSDDRWLVIVYNFSSFYIAGLSTRPGQTRSQNYWANWQGLPHLRWLFEPGSDSQHGINCELYTELLPLVTGVSLKHFHESLCLFSRLKMHV